MKKQKIKESGFSLIEVLFAVLFLSLIVFGVIRLQTSNLILTNTQKNQLKANFYLQQGLEIVSALATEQVNSCSNPCYLKKTNNAYSLVPNPPEKLEGDLFERSFSKTTEGLSSGANLLTVSLKWSDGTGDHESLAKRIVIQK